MCLLTFQAIGNCDVSKRADRTASESSLCYEDYSKIIIILLVVICEMEIIDLVVYLPA